MKFCVCDSVLEKIHVNLCFKHRVGLLEIAAVIILEEARELKMFKKLKGFNSS
jgi:hypothetical protein